MPAPTASRSQKPRDGRKFKLEPQVADDRTDGNPITFLFEAGSIALLGKRIVNVSDRRRNRDSGQRGFLGTVPVTRPTELPISGLLAQIVDGFSGS
jgi:hypothetical protein